ncbi:MAG: hypothetical protein ACK55Z_26610 [bacterium]
MAANPQGLGTCHLRHVFVRKARADRDRVTMEIGFLFQESFLIYR